MTRRTEEKCINQLFLNVFDELGKIIKPLIKLPVCVIYLILVINMKNQEIALVNTLLAIKIRLNPLNA